MDKKEIKKKKPKIKLSESHKKETKPEKKTTDTKKDKKWFDRFFNKEKLKKINKVAVVFLRDNGLVDFKELEAKNEEFKIEGDTFHVDRDCIYTTQKDRIPLAIIREWDMAPLGTKKWYDTDGIEEIDDKIREKFAQLEKHVLRGIKNAELYKVSGKDFGSNISMKQVILYVLVAFILGAIVVGYL